MRFKAEHYDHGTYEEERRNAMYRQKQKEEKYNHEMSLEAYRARSHSKSPAELLAEEAADQEYERNAPY